MGIAQALEKHNTTNLTAHELLLAHYYYSIQCGCTFIW